MTEKSFAKDIDAKLVKNSGRGYIKADMTKGDYVIDLKEVAKSFTLNERVWGKIASDAFQHGWEKIPMLIVKFNEGPTLVIHDIRDMDWEKHG